MSQQKSAARNLLLSFVWLLIIVTLALVWRFVVAPEQKKRLTEDTGADSQYRHRLHLGLDSFSGYAVFRSPLLQDLLRSGQIKLVCRDDGGDTSARLDALRHGELQMAVFTLDSWILAGAARGDWPGTIVLVLDESRGADALVAQPGGPASLQELDDPAARFVLTPRSPSEFLARVVISHFHLPRLGPDWLEGVDGPEAVFRRYLADGAGRRVYALWEPWVSRAVRDGAARVLVDTEKLRGYVVDVLLVERRFLKEQPQLVKSFVEAYLAAAHHFTRDEAHLSTLVREDNNGAAQLTAEEATRVASGILWKNTLENYAHFAVLPASERRGLPLLEDQIGRIADVLVQTGALAKNPLEDKAHVLLHDGLLQELFQARFHPGQALARLTGENTGGEGMDEIRTQVGVRPLQEEEWSRLVPVGQLRIPPVSFGRGGARIHMGSQRELTSLAAKLEAWPHAYLKVTGRSRSEGDAEANRRLARERAQAVVDFLVAQGVARERLQVENAEAAGQGGEAQSVSFDLGQLPY